MTPNVKAPPSPKASRFQRWLERPSLLAASMPTEIIPQGLASLELKLTGWGWVRLEGTENFEPRRWFWHDQVLTLFVPVGSHPVLTLGNLWGSKSYQVDATSGRDEILVSHDEHYIFKLPDSALTNLPQAPKDTPTAQWKAAGINASGSGHWRVHMPTGHSVALPAAPPAVSLPNLTHDDWRASAPMDELDRRLKRVAITD